VSIDLRGTITERLVLVRDVLWYKVNKHDQVRLVIVRDPDGVENDDYFLTTDLSATGAGRAGAAEAKTPGGHPERVRGAQRWIVPGEGLVEVDGHRLRRGDLPVGRGARERLLPPPTRPRTHARIIALHHVGG